MPLYDYRCRECGHELEIRQKFSDDPLSECPNCGEEELFRVVQAAGVVFKGSGFYITDSRGNRENLTAPAKKNGSDDGKPPTKSDSKTEKSTSKATDS